MAQPPMQLAVKVTQRGKLFKACAGSEHHHRADVRRRFNGSNLRHLNIALPAHVGILRVPGGQDKGPIQRDIVGIPSLQSDPIDTRSIAAQRLTRQGVRVFQHFGEQCLRRRTEQVFGAEQGELGAQLLGSRFNQLLLDGVRLSRPMRQGQVGLLGLLITP